MPGMTGLANQVLSTKRNTDCPGHQILLQSKSAEAHGVVDAIVVDLTRARLFSFLPPSTAS